MIKLYMFLKSVSKHHKFCAAVIWELNLQETACDCMVIETQLFKSAFLNWGWFCSPGAIWQCLEVLWLLQQGKKDATVIGNQGSCWLSYCAQASPSQWLPSPNHQQRQGGEILVSMKEKTWGPNSSIFTMLNLFSPGDFSTTKKISSYI